MKEIYHTCTSAFAVNENVVKGAHFRFTVLTEQLIRLEYSNEGTFVDEPSQVVWHRDFKATSFKVDEDDENLVIRTTGLVLTYKKEQRFSKDSLNIEIAGDAWNNMRTWYYGTPIQTLKGTTRTLDACDGEVELEEGIISRQGFSILDDSKSLLLQENGELKVRASENIDCYFFGYGNNYKKCIKDFFHLTGNPPMLPKYALGNWWSRYHRYTEEEYKELIQTFIDKKIPLAVAVIDMDWHITDVNPKYGSGWTGYTWNRELFPDPEEFIQWLHKHNLRVTLNVHPAEGVRAFEACYPEMAKHLGYDIEKEEAIPFNVADEKFLEAYFEYIHYPHEKMGIDFWWIDWQQGQDSSKKGLDPLWALNHYHYLDNCKNNKRGLILSRYAQPGSHRYPIGFSGDTIISWDSLKFQPYFTATASNIGYCWWSHDIGGHMLGVYDEELQIRWIELGVFSPIMRIHSSASEFNHKEPWNYSMETEAIVTKYMRLRHKLIPYLYTMNWLLYKNGTPPIMPMYYEYPDDIDAYEIKNQYMFGSQLMVLPITSKCCELNLAKEKIWFPEGIYIDFMTGMIYDGNRMSYVYRRKDEIPVFMKAGAIVPLDDLEHTNQMEVYVASGADGMFELYEDDGETRAFEQGKYATTLFKMTFGENTAVTVEPPKGDATVIPEDREYVFHFIGFSNPKEIQIQIGEQKKKIPYTYNSKRNEIILSPVKANKNEIKILFDGKLGKNDIQTRCFELLDYASIDFLTKEIVYDWMKKKTIPGLLSSLQVIDINQELYGAISEILLAQGGNDKA